MITLSKIAAVAAVALIGAGCVPQTVEVVKLVSVPTPSPVYPGECYRTAPLFPKVPIPKGAKVVGAPALLGTLDKGSRQYDALVAEKEVCRSALPPPKTPDAKPAS